MANIPGINVPDTIDLYTDADVKPVTRSNRNQGGHHSYFTLAERDAISAERRQEGMLCSVKEAGEWKIYQLKDGIDNSNWVEFEGGRNLQAVDELPDPEDAMPGVFYATTTGQPAVPGPAGTTPDIQIGTVTTVPSTVGATVKRRISSTNEAPIFDFEIPMGPPGDSSIGSSGTSALTDAQEKLVRNAVAGINPYISPDSLTLAVISDTHARDQDDTIDLEFRSMARSLTNMNQSVMASRICRIDGIVLLGDSTDGGQVIPNTKVRTLEIWMQFVDILNHSVPLFMLRGNHDDNSDSNINTDYVLPADDWVKVALLPCRNEAIYDTKRPFSPYYYRDFDSQKIRCIFLDYIDYPWVVNGTALTYYAGNSSRGQGWSARQVTWLHEEALDFNDKPDAEEWATLVFCHSRECSRSTDIVNNGTMVMGVLDAYNKKKAFKGVNNTTNWAVNVDVDFSEDITQGLIAYIQGHNHQDFVIRPGENIGALEWQKNPYSFLNIGVANGYHSVNGYSQLINISRKNSLIKTYSICDNAAINSSIYTRQREILIPAPIMPSGPMLDLTQGSLTYNGVTITINGNRITLDGTVTAQSGYVHITGDSPMSGTIGSYEYNAPAAWVEPDLFYVGQGNLVRWAMTNITGSVTATGTSLVFRVYYSDGARLSTSAGGIPNYNVPNPATKHVAPTDYFGVAVLALNYAGDVFTNYSFDIEGYVTTDGVEKRIL